MMLSTTSSLLQGAAVVLFTASLQSALAITTTATNATTLAALSSSLTHVESVRQIKDLQRSYAHYAQFGQWDEMASLFSRNGTLIWGNAASNGTTVTIRNDANGSAIATWLRDDAGAMDGVAPDSLNTVVIENPVVNLAVDGRSAKGRWNGLRFSGDGKGGTRIRGGIYENEYVRIDKENGRVEWQILVLRYYAMYEGPYEGGWRNAGGGGIPVVPYHFTPEESGILIPDAVEEAPKTNVSVEEVDRRISRLNDEDQVRNIMHAHGYYVDRRMWSDVVDLHTADTTVTIVGVANYTGLGGVRKALERMGPEDLQQGIANDHPIFDMIVRVAPDGNTAMARGVEIAMLGDTSKRTASWEFNIFRNQFVKDNGVWLVKDVEITPLLIADYSKGWGDGGIKPRNNSYVPPFLSSYKYLNRDSKLAGTSVPSRTDLEDLQRRLQRSAAYDGAENQSHAYGYFLDDIDCGRMGGLFAKRGHKASPFAGFFITPERINQACIASYGTNRSALRQSISFHWRPQPVVLVSEDGRSATLRARLLQPSTSATRAGSFNNAIYHDQMVLENGKWRLWSVTIDEFYWTSSTWKDGWANATPRNSSAPNPEPAPWTKKYPPDVTIAEVGFRESTFRGGSGQYIEWPEIQRMWFQYSNLASGRVPEYYWPGCVPCQVRPDWALVANGYQEPPIGPVR